MDEQPETTQENIPISIITPLIYVGVTLSLFILFSIIYRRKRVENLSHMQPIFKTNYNSEIYNELKAKNDDPSIKKENKVHEKVLKAALLRKAVESIRRSMKLKEFESSFNKLYQLGLIGDDFYKQYEIQIKYQELEIKEIVQEVESYKKGWVQTFFPLAQEICFNEALRRRLKATDERSEVLTELWDLKT
ncbi:unnamed protein product [Candida verbasci]|uniref:Sec66p n=1 Tax=Candida verbasci TaxID=1227364 RepID=A0A9W4TYP0_9ASCO|nr:unnamed protein product [Candida verbasci]